MKIKFEDAVYYLAVLILFAGWFLALLPHAFHTAVGLTEQSHETHTLEGIGLVVLGVLMLIVQSRMRKK